eukprot:gene12042-biopygen3001
MRPPAAAVAALPPGATLWGQRTGATLCSQPTRATLWPQPTGATLWSQAARPALANSDRSSRDIRHLMRLLAQVLAMLNGSTRCACSGSRGTHTAVGAPRQFSSIVCYQQRESAPLDCPVLGFDLVSPLPRMVAKAAIKVAAKRGGMAAKRDKMAAWRHGVNDASGGTVGGKAWRHGGKAGGKNAFGGKAWRHGGKAIALAAKQAMPTELLSRLLPGGIGSAGLSNASASASALPSDSRPQMSMLGFDLVSPLPRWRHGGKGGDEAGGIAAERWRQSKAWWRQSVAAWRQSETKWRPGGMVPLMPLAAQLAAKRGDMTAKLAASMPLAANRGGMAAEIPHWR